MRIYDNTNINVKRSGCHRLAAHETTGASFAVFDADAITASNMSACGCSDGRGDNQAHAVREREWSVAAAKAGHDATRSAVVKRTNSAHMGRRPATT